MLMHSVRGIQHQISAEKRKNILSGVPLREQNRNEDYKCGLNNRVQYADPAVIHNLKQRLEKYLIAKISEYLLENRSMQVDELYAEFNNKYYKKIDFEIFIYAVDFLFLIKKIKIQSNDILEVVK